MNQEQFESACAEAIKPYHEPQQDGPLLVSIRPESVKMMGNWIVFPTYAACIGMWPEAQAGAYGALSNPGPRYSDCPRQIIAALLSEAKGKCQNRQTECDCPKCDPDPICHCGAALSDHERNPLAYEHSFTGYPCTKNMQPKLTQEPLLTELPF